jgi:hypothetical protein
VNISPVSFITDSTLQEYNICAGKGCQKTGIHQLHVIYLNRKGWFCNSCKDSLVSEGLVKEDNDIKEGTG